MKFEVSMHGIEAVGEAKDRGTELDGDPLICLFCQTSLPKISSSSVTNPCCNVQQGGGHRMV